MVAHLSTRHGGKRFRSLSYRDQRAADRDQFGRRHRRVPRTRQRRRSLVDSRRLAVLECDLSRRWRIRDETIFTRHGDWSAALRSAGRDRLCAFLEGRSSFSRHRCSRGVTRRLLSFHRFRKSPSARTVGVTNRNHNLSRIFSARGRGVHLHLDGPGRSAKGIAGSQ